MKPSRKIVSASSQQNNGLNLGLGSETTAAQHVNEYLEYCHLVGDNGGPLMSEKEYQAYKQNYNAQLQHRLYSTWYNPEKLACKNVGPSSKCFCDHAYKYHDYLEGKGDKVKCKNPGCKCLNFSYLPVHGSQDLKCSCKHSYANHEPNKKTCLNCPCKNFSSTWACTCGFKYGEHRTLHQNQATKEQQGQTVGLKQGAVISYSSMLDGAERFSYGIKEQVKKKGLKVTIEEFTLSKEPVLQEQVSAWELMNRPMTWLK